MNHAVAAGRIDHRPRRATSGDPPRRNLIRRLPSDRRDHVAAALDQIASFPGRMTGPRAVALIGQLRANNSYFARHSAPAAKTDIMDSDGIVYRYFAGRCFEFHPLAEFGALNARVSAGDAAARNGLRGR